MLQNINYKLLMADICHYINLKIIKYVISDYFIYQLKKCSYIQ